MPTDKPQYAGKRAWKMPLDFSEALPDTLATLYRDAFMEDESLDDEQTQKFINAVLSEARFALPELHALDLALTKQEVIAEHDDLLLHLKAVEKKLRDLSPDYNLLLGTQADPLDCADKIGSCANAILDLRAHMHEAKSRIVSRTPVLKPAKIKHDIAVELAIRVLRVLNAYGITGAATAGSYTRSTDVTKAAVLERQESQYVSPAVRMLKCIGDDIGLKLQLTTWRDTILSAKKRAADIR